LENIFPHAAPKRRLRFPHPSHLGKYIATTPECSLTKSIMTVVPKENCTSQGRIEKRRKSVEEKRWLELQQLVPSLGVLAK